MDWFRDKAAPPIGLDLDCRCFRAVQRGREPDSGQITAVSEPRNDLSAPFSEAEADRLCAMLEAGGFLGRRLVIAAPSSASVSSVLELPPRGSGAPLKDIARSEMARLHACKPDELTLAIWDLPRPARAGDATFTMATACSLEQVSALVEALEGRGWDVAALDSRARALARSSAPHLTGVVGMAAIVEIGWREARLVVLKDEVVVYERVLASSGLTRLVEALAEEFGVPSEEVCDTIGQLTVTRAEHEEPALTRLRDRVAAFIQDLAEELHAPFCYVENLYSDSAIRRMLLAGPGARIGGLADYMGELLDVDARVAAAGSGATDDGPEWATAIGLALYPDGEDRAVNLVTQTHVYAKDRRLRIRTWIRVCCAHCALMALVLLLWWILGPGGAKCSAADVEQAGQRIQRYDRELSDARQQLAALRSEREAQHLVASQPDWSILLALISRHLGPDVVLKGLRFDDTALEAAAKAEGSQDDPPGEADASGAFVFELIGLGRSQTAISQFVLRLEQAEIFDNVKLIKTNRETYLSGRAVAFQLACTLEPR